MNNIPFISIMISMVASVVMLLLGKKSEVALKLAQGILLLVAILSLVMIP